MLQHSKKVSLIKQVGYNGAKNVPLSKTFAFQDACQYSSEPCEADSART